MDIKSRILTTLVTSAASEHPQRALDLTRAGCAARTLISRGVDCRRIPLPDELYGLVICTVSTLPKVISRIEAEGSLIVHVQPGQHGALLGLATEFALVASARTPTGAWVRLRRLAETSSVPPRVSVIVPLQDHAGPLAQLLSTLEDQPTDPAWELVAIDRGSTDATADLLQQVTGDIRRVRIARDSDEIDALFAGFRAARGDVLVPLAAGLAPSCGFVSAILRHVDQTPPSHAPLLGKIMGMDGRLVPGRMGHALRRSSTPSTPRRLAKWLERSDGTEIPGLRFRQLVPGPLPSLAVATQRLDRGSDSQSNTILAQRRQRLEQGG